MERKTRTLIEFSHTELIHHFIGPNYPVWFVQLIFHYFMRKKKESSPTLHNIRKHITNIQHANIISIHSNDTYTHTHITQSSSDAHCSSVDWFAHFVCCTIAMLSPIPLPLPWLPFPPRVMTSIPVRRVRVCVSAICTQMRTHNTQFRHVGLSSRAMWASNGTDT